MRIMRTIGDVARVLNRIEQLVTEAVPQRAVPSANGVRIERGACGSRQALGALPRLA